NSIATNQSDPLPLHDALPISKRNNVKIKRNSHYRYETDTPIFEPRTGRGRGGRADPTSGRHHGARPRARARRRRRARPALRGDRSEEHTSELQSRENLVCRLL